MPCSAKVAPTHQRHLGPGLRVADHGRWIVREDAGHRLQVAHVAIDHAEEREDGGLIGGDAAEVANGPPDAQLFNRFSKANLIGRMKISVDGTLAPRMPSAFNRGFRTKDAPEQRQ